ncbi:MAG: hypothetical protein OER90_12620, partial [Gemmatimonadota bacterium]|nr:hypothetical protein [Gemmatimonadota bacterium]
MKLLALFVLGGFLGCMRADADGGEPEPCDYFHRTLSAVPHDTLMRSTGDIAWMWDNETHQGCEVR